MKLVEFFTHGTGKRKKAYTRLTTTHLFDPNIIPNDATNPIHSQLNNNIIGTSKHDSPSNLFSDTYHTNSPEVVPDNNSLNSHNQHAETPISIDEQGNKKDKEKNDLIFKTPMQTIDSGLGLRYFFTCPHCFIRTSRLYFALTIGCRKCLNLSYHSQNISNEDR